MQILREMDAHVEMAARSSYPQLGQRRPRSAPDDLQGTKAQRTRAADIACLCDGNPPARDSPLVRLPDAVLQLAIKQARTCDKVELTVDAILPAGFKAREENALENAPNALRTVLAFDVSRTLVHLYPSTQAIKE